MNPPASSQVTGKRAEKSSHFTHKGCLYPDGKASSQVADALKLHANAQVTRLTRVRHLEHVNENAPVVYTTVYVPHQLFPEMSQLDFTDASLYEALDARGLAVAHASRRLEVTMPPAEIAVDLKISPL